MYVKERKKKIQRSQFHCFERYNKYKYCCMAKPEILAISLFMCHNYMGKKSIPFLILIDIINVVRNFTRPLRNVGYNNNIFCD